MQLTREAPQPQSGLQHQITIPEPLIRHSVTPHAWEEGKNEGSYLEEITAFPYS